MRDFLFLTSIYDERILREITEIDTHLFLLHIEILNDDTNEEIQCEE